MIYKINKQILLESAYEPLVYDFGGIYGDNVVPGDLEYKDKNLEGLSDHGLRYGMYNDLDQKGAQVFNNYNPRYMESLVLADRLNDTAISDINSRLKHEEHYNREANVRAIEQEDKLNNTNIKSNVGLGLGAAGLGLGMYGLRRRAR